MCSACLVNWIDCEIDTVLFTNSDKTFLSSNSSPFFLLFFTVRIFLCYLNSPASIFQAPRVQEECLNFVYVEAGLGTPVLYQSVS